MHIQAHCDAPDDLTLDLKPLLEIQLEIFAADIKPRFYFFQRYHRVDSFANLVSHHLHIVASRDARRCGDHLHVVRRVRYMPLPKLNQ